MFLVPSLKILKAFSISSKLDIPTDMITGFPVLATSRNNLWLTTSKENVWTPMARSLAGVMMNKPSACVKVGVMPFSGAGTSVDAVVDISASRRVPVSPDRVILGGVVRERENAGDDSDPYLQPATS